MSSSGITPLNSGPLLIRTYLDGSSNNSYALGAYEKSVSSNRVLITSTAGLIAPSDNIYISSISVSSINGLPYPPVDDALWSLVGSTVVNDNPGPVQITSSLICSSITSISSIFAPGVFNISSLQGTFISAPKFEYLSQDSSTIGTFKIELYGSNLLVYRSTIGISSNTHIMNNGGSKLVLGTNNPVIFINGPNDTNNYVGIATSTPQYVLDVAGKINTTTAFYVSTNGGGGAIRSFSDSGKSYIESGTDFSAGTSNSLLFTNMGASLPIAPLTVDMVNSSIGILNQTPQYTLDVAGRERITQFGADTTTADATLIAANSASGRSINFLTNCTAGAYNSIANVGDLGIMFNNSTIDTGNLWIGPWASGVAKGIKILTNGNVGIGAATPDAALQVAGTLSTNTIVDNSGSSGTSGQVLTAGTGGQVIWAAPSMPPAPTWNAWINRNGSGGWDIPAFPTKIQMTNSMPIVANRTYRLSTTLQINSAGAPSDTLFVSVYDGANDVAYFFASDIQVLNEISVTGFSCIFKAAITGNIYLRTGTTAVSGTPFTNAIISYFWAPGVLLEDLGAI